MLLSRMGDGLGYAEWFDEPGGDHMEDCVNGNVVSGEHDRLSRVVESGPSPQPGPLAIVNERLGQGDIGTARDPWKL